MLGEENIGVQSSGYPTLLPSEFNPGLALQLLIWFRDRDLHPSHHPHKPLRQHHHLIALLAVELPEPGVAPRLPAAVHPPPHAGQVEGRGRRGAEGLEHRPVLAPRLGEPVAPDRGLFDRGPHRLGHRVAVVHHPGVIVEVAEFQVQQQQFVRRVQLVGLGEMPAPRDLDAL